MNLCERDMDRDVSECGKGQKKTSHYITNHGQILIAERRDDVTVRVEINP